jgi:hypothetical protein
LITMMNSGISTQKVKIPTISETWDKSVLLKG